MGLIVLNDVSPTWLNTRNTLTSADVSKASADLASCLKWMILCSPETTNHFPVIINNGGAIYRKLFQPKFLENRANWSAFSTKISCFMEEFNQSDNINRESVQIKRII